MLTDADNERFDAIMNKVLQRREERVFPPDRDEDRIIEILWNADMAAAREHALLVETKQNFASAVKFQESVGESNEGKEFPQLDRYRNFESD